VIYLNIHQLNICIHLFAETDIHALDRTPLKVSPMYSR
jgi:hypothetical protein